VAIGVVGILAVAWLLVGPAPSALRGRGVHEGREAARAQATRDGGEAGSKRGAHAPGEGETITLTPERRQKLGVKVEPAQARVPEARLTVTGKIAANPDRTVVVAPRTPGRVVKVNAQLGDTVEAGATLALVDSVEAADALGDLAQTDSTLALAQARADQEKQLYEAKLRVLETARQQPTAEAALKELAQVELGRAKQEYIAALAKLESAQTDLEREKRLVEGKIGARKELLRAEKAALVATAELTAVAEGIRLTARRELLEAETALQQARAQRDKVREKLRLLGLTDSVLAQARQAQGGRLLTPLVAPLRGTVIERQASEGQLLDAAAVPFRIADLSTVWALLDVPETDVALLRAGQEAVIEVGRDGKVVHTGRVVHIGDVVEEQTRTVKVRVEVPNPHRHFKPGMFVTGRITSRHPGPAVLMVPKDAVVLLDEGPVVFVLRGEEAHPRPVEVGPEVEGWIPVRKGLSAGEQVVTEGAFTLKAQLVKAKLGEE
jgi:cobalt-zinc-cadmium efflux system membrane fusion protein